MSNVNFLDMAKEIESELICHRRTIHKNGGTGFDIKPTTEYVFNKLVEYGYKPEIVAEAGVVCTVGRPGKTILMRADMDALPMQEETGLEFAAENGTAHTCGHDAHTAMLLGAAKMLKEREDELKGTVKFVFQPAEEICAGAEAMVKAGVLENPKVDFAFSMHNIVGTECPGMPTGALRFTPGPTYASNDAFEIIVKGHGCHGAKPEEGVDPISIGANIVNAIHHIIAMEKAPKECGVISLGQFVAGNIPNAITDTAILRGTIRTYNETVRNFLKDRLIAVVENTAKVYRGEAKVNWMFGVPAVISDPKMAEDIKKYYTEIMPEDYVRYMPAPMASEDFSHFSNNVPSVMVGMSFGCPEEGYLYGGHHPKMTVNEEALKIGSALYAQVAYRWLEEH